MADEARIALGRRIYEWFVQRGLSPHQAAAIAGNMAWESGGRWDLVNPNDNRRGSPMAPHSIGIAQWNDRSPALIAYARQQGIELPEGDLRDPRYAQEVIRRIPLETQLAFAWNEMQGPERRAYEAILAGGDLESATAGAIGYHRPAGWTRTNPYAGHGYSGRLALARMIMGGGAGSPSTPTPTATATPTPTPTGGPSNVPTPLSPPTGGPHQPPDVASILTRLFQPGQGQGQGAGQGAGQVDPNTALAQSAMAGAGTPEPMQAAMQPMQPMQLPPMVPRRPIDTSQLWAALAPRRLGGA